MKKTEYFVEGTLGDCFIASLKLINDKFIRIFHRTKHTYWYPEIKSIYNFLLPDVEVFFTSDNRKDLIEINSNCHLQTETMEFFPKLPYIESILYNEPYIILQAHSGKLNGGNTKRLSYDTIYRIIDFFDPVKIVLIGIDKYYTEVKKCYNLIGIIDIPTAFNLIKYSSGFVGPEGLMSFVALSQRKNSIIFYREKEAVDRRIINTPWEKYCISLIKMDNDFY